jgi:hypothetical protein
MYELTTVYSEKREYPTTEKFDTHSPLLTGASLSLYRREGERVRMLTTSRVVDIYQIHANIWRLKTESGSIYELKQL